MIPMVATSALYGEGPASEFAPAAKPAAPVHPAFSQARGVFSVASGRRTGPMLVKTGAVSASKSAIAKLPDPLEGQTGRQTIQSQLNKLVDPTASHRVFFPA